MKQIITSIALLLIAATLFTACGNENTEATEAGQMKNIYQKSDPSQDDTLNILMIGSSFCYYYVEELYGMLDSIGIKANVCNVYYSGCPLEKHFTWWKTGEAHYDYYMTNADGRVKTAGANLEWCLQQQNWDIISLQESTSKIFNAGFETHLETTKIWRTELWSYLKEQFPMSRYLWHQPWTYQIGTASNGYVMETSQQQDYNTNQVKEFALVVCKELDLERVNTGEAWQIVRNEYGYDNLCARIGKGENNAGDNYHDGDWGGGQYLNACVWFEIIIGQSCIGNTYRPKYEDAGLDLSLSEDLVQMLQQAAHKAVEQLNSTN